MRLVPDLATRLAMVIFATEHSYVLGLGKNLRHAFLKMAESMSEKWLTHKPECVSNGLEHGPVMVCAQDAIPLENS